MAMRILAETYHGNLDRRTMPDDEARKFKEAVKKAFEKILAYPIGIELGKEINSADCDLSVLKAGEEQGNHCIPERQGPEDLKQACYKEVLDVNLLYAKIGQLTSTGKITADHPAVKKFSKFYFAEQKGGKREQYTEMLGAGKNKVPYPIAHKSPDEAKKAAHTTEGTMRGRVWLQEGEAKINEAVGYVRSLQNGLIGYHLMSYLIPGSGTAAFVVWDPEMADAGADLGESERAAWMTRPGWIALVHELIHGWRLVTGQCVFRPEPLIEGYYEEAMTVGLPPYDGCKFTENRFRLYSGEPPRTFYGQKTRVISRAAQRKHKPTDESIWAPGEANPPYDRLLQGTLTYRSQSEEQFTRELEGVAVGAARKSTRKSLRVLIFGPRDDSMTEVIKWTETTIGTLNRLGYEFRISRTFFDAGTIQVRLYDHLRSG
jgi:Effector protein